MHSELDVLCRDFVQHSRQRLPERFSLYPGIELAYLDLRTESLTLHHRPMGTVLQANYCRAGRAGWQMGNGNYIYLGPGNLSLHMMDTCTDSHLTFPTGQYEGVLLCIDLQEAAEKPPSLLAGTDVFCRLQERLNNQVISLACNAQLEGIFSGFYGQPEALRLPYQRLKTLELLLWLGKTEFPPGIQPAEYSPGLVEAIQEIHERLVSNMERRITIEELSKQYLINPTTLKNIFKSVYGTSLATHIKKHRMEQAAKMLRETDMSVAEIAQSVGYDSQSKFSAAFKSCFQALPKDYRRKPPQGLS